MILEWAQRWNIPAAALIELRQFTLPTTVPGVDRSESAVKSRVRLAASYKGIYVWRNNCGVAFNAQGQPVRFGLANDSARVGETVKSGDLIGIRPRIITVADVGHLIGQFVSWEIKRSDWTFDPNDARESAQFAWATLVNSLGGEGRFINDERQV